MGLRSLPWIAGLAVASIVATMAAGPSAPGTDAPQFVHVRAVEYSLLAQDEHGNPVPDLTAADLSVRDGSRELVFRLFDPRPEASGDASEPTDVRLELRIGSEAQRAVSSSVAPHYYLLFLDLSADSLQDREGARDAVTRFLDETLQPQDLVAVVSFSANLNLELPFRRDRSAVVRAVDSAYGRPKASGITTRQRIRVALERLEVCQRVPDHNALLDQFDRESNEAVFGSIDADEGCVIGLGHAYIEESRARAERLLHALDAALRFAGGVQPGATLIAVTHGVTLEPEREFRELARGVVGHEQWEEVEPELNSGESSRTYLHGLVQRATRQCATLYFVDPAPRPAGIGASRQTLLVQGSNPMQLAYELPQSTLQEIAQATGGAFIADPDLLAGLRRTDRLEHLGRRDLLVYVDETLTDDQVERISISSRRRGVRLTRGRTFDCRTGEAASASVTFGEARPPAHEGRGVYVPFLLGVRPDDLGYEAQGQKMVADLTLHLLVETVEGRHLASAYHFFRHAVPKQEWESRRTARLGIEGWLEAPGGAYRMAAVFRNAKSGHEGRFVRRVSLSGP